MPEILAKNGRIDRATRPGALASMAFVGSIAAVVLVGLTFGAGISYGLETFWGFRAELFGAWMLAVGCASLVILAHRKVVSKQSGDARIVLQAFAITCVIGLIFGTLGSAFVDVLGNSTL
jgi:hypothetical protein